MSAPLPNVADLTAPHILLTWLVESARPHHQSWPRLTSPQILHHIIWWNCILLLPRLIESGPYAFYVLSAYFHIWMNFQVISKDPSYHSITGSMSIPLWSSNNFKIAFWSACELVCGHSALNAPDLIWSMWELCHILLKDVWECIFRTLFQN